LSTRPTSRSTSPPAQRRRPEAMPVFADMTTDASTGATAPWRPQRARRVALVVDRLAAGGKERVVAALAGRLRAMGLASHIICLHSPGSMAASVRAAGVPVISLDSTGPADLGAVRRLGRLLTRLRPDVINVHDRFSLPYAAAARRLAGAGPLVFSCHGLLLSSVRPGLWQTLAAEDVAAFTAVAPHVAESYAAFFGATAPVEIIPNGVIPMTADRAQREKARQALGLAADAFAFLAVGSIRPEKGYEDLLAAAASLAGSGKRFRLLIAGGVADSATSQRLTKMLEDRKLADVVTMLGHRDDVASLYAAADAFVLASRTEGLPLALLEAASAGLPIVATAVGDVVNVIGPDGGLLVRPGQPETLAAAMDHVLGSRSLRKRLGGSAATTARRDYGLDAMATHYASLFERTVAARAKLGRASVLLVVPRTPVTGGMATVLREIEGSALGESFHVRAINTGKISNGRRRFIGRVLCQARLFRRVIQRLLSGGADLLHIHTCSGLTFWRDALLAATARLFRRRTVWHIHGGRFGAFVRSQGALSRRLVRWSLEHASSVVTLSDGLRHRLASMAPQARWRVVPNGVPVEPTEQPPSGRFLFLGNLGSNKGAADLVAAAALARKQGCVLSVDIAGDEVSPGQREDLASAIDAAGLTESVRLVGLISGPAKRRALLAAGCLVLPSYIEAMPLAVLEAMACGRPVIATRVGAVAEVIRHEREGLLVAPGDVEGLASAMMRLAEDAPLRECMGAAARQRAEQAYSDSAMVRGLQSVYTEALKG